MRLADRLGDAGPTKAPTVVVAVVALLLTIAATFAADAGALTPRPAGRTYELVTPADTGGVAPFQQTGGGTVVVDDDTLIYGGSVVPTGPVESGAEATFVARRGVFGWESTSLLPDRIGPGEKYRLVDATRDLSASLWFTEKTEGLTEPPPQFEFSRRFRYRDAEGRYTTILDIGSNDGLQPKYGGMSSGAKAVVFASRIPPPGIQGTGGLEKVYVWHPDGSVQVLGASGPLANCNVTVAGLNASNLGYITNEVSADGDSVFLASQVTPGVAGCPQESEGSTEPSAQIYLEHDGQTTLISGIEGGEAEPAQAPAAFDGATPDGKTAYLSSTAPLTAEDNEPGQPNLYRWEAEGNHLRCLSCGPAGEISYLRGPPALSEDGSYAWFVTVRGSREPEETAETLRLEHDGQVREVSDLGALSPFADIPLQSSALNSTGDVLVFLLSNGGPSSQIYRAVAGSGSIAAAPLASNRAGEPVSGSATALQGLSNDAIGSSSPRGTSGLAGTLHGNVSDDGGTVVFESTEALAYGADAGEHNLYAWEEGQISYLGQAAAQTDFEGVSLSDDGQDIFFASPEQLTPQEGEVAPSIYDARIDGGFPPRPTPPAPCSSALTCQGPPQASAGGPSPARGPGSGNPSPKTLVLHHPGRAALASAARTGTLVLRLKAGGGGVVRAIAQAELGRRRTTVAAGRQKVPAVAKDLRVALRLNQKAKTQLEEGGDLRLRISVSLAGLGSRTTVVALKEGGK